LVEGLRASGVDVHRIGMGPTPMLYFSVHHLHTDGGIMLTGSHNPPDYNGFKMMMGHGPFFGEDIQALGALAAAGDFTTGEGNVTKHDIIDAYGDRLMRDFSAKKQLKIVWDSGNGAGGPMVNEIGMRLPSNHILLNVEVDGTFPNHHPDPTEPKNLVQMIAAVKERGADLGIALDGDADRIGVVDGQGRILWGDQLMIILARAVLAERPGSTIIADVKASQVLYDEIAKAGGVPLMWRTGHSLIKTKMKETGSPLAGEMSGHIFFADRYYGFDDALYAAIRLIEIIANGDKSLAELRDTLPETVNTPELRFPCSDERKFAVIDEVKAWLNGKPGMEVNTVDGVRVKTADGWWLLRASNTQDVLVARCESSDEAGLARLKQALSDALRAVGMEPPAL
ncbi:MAG: phosphomannomutase/phosphoglucomutase, partial [Alphaproteobacteria bacterium]|nr:phosphomannomutase/phosphoglucomutase [Alphaproteobacteria bacterium]